MQNNNLFEYSPEAVGVLNLFYEKDYILYVEGDDDIPFWTAIFKELSNAKVEALALYGAGEIDKKIEDVLRDDLKVIIARDSDYKRIDGTAITDPRILYTFGYSIENSLFGDEVIQDIVFSWTRGKAKEHHDAHAWLERFFNSIKEIIILDLANHMHSKGLLIMGENCGQFMASKDSPEVSPEKVNDFTNGIKKLITTKEIEAATKALECSSLNAKLFMKGHFLQSAVHKYLTDRMKKAGRKANASFDAIYSSALPSFSKLLKTDSIESMHYSTSINSAVNAIKN